MIAKIVSIVGARPQFIKCAPVSRALRAHTTEILVHSGQHYDDNMSAAFFRELAIPEADHNLAVGSGSHGAQTGAILTGIERVLMQERPDMVLVYGDTNSTLAGALAAAKLHIPVAHVEAGLRSFNRRMPEEINRVLTDHVSSLLFCPTETATHNLETEGITEGVHRTGDVMYDAVVYNRDVARQRATIATTLRLSAKSFLLATVHRAENTDDVSRLREILHAFGSMANTHRVIWPVHPRTRARLSSVPDIGHALDRVELIDPVSYLDMLWLTENAAAVLTDSGGLQKEACWLGTPCVTLRDETEWVETLANGRNRLAGASAECILSAVEESLTLPTISTGTASDAGAAQRIASLVCEWCA